MLLPTIVGGCEEPQEFFAFVNDTPGAIHLFFNDPSRGPIDKGTIAPGATYRHPQRPVARANGRFHPIDDEEQFRHAMRNGITLVDSAGRRRSFDVTALRALMTYEEPRLFTMHIRPELFEPAR